jgi:hypothetical protein
MPIIMGTITKQQGPQPVIVACASLLLLVVAILAKSAGHINLDFFAILISISFVGLLFGVLSASGEAKVLLRWGLWALIFIVALLGLSVIITWLFVYLSH